MIKNNMLALLVQIGVAVFISPLLGVMFDWTIGVILAGIGLFVLYIFIGTKMTSTQSASEDLLSVIAPSFLGFIVLYLALADRQDYNGSLGIISIDPIILWYFYNPIGTVPGMMIDWIDQPVFEFLVYILMTLMPTFLLWVGLLRRRKLKIKMEVSK